MEIIDSNTHHALPDCYLDAYVGGLDSANNRGIYPFWTEGRARSLVEKHGGYVAMDSNGNYLAVIPLTSTSHQEPP